MPMLFSLTEDATSIRNKELIPRYAAFPSIDQAFPGQCLGVSFDNDVAHIASLVRDPSYTSQVFSGHFSVRKVATLQTCATTFLMAARHQAMT